MFARSEFSRHPHQGSRDFLAQIDPLLNNRRYLGRSMMFGFYQEQDVVFMSCKANFYVVRFIFTLLLSIQTVYSIRARLAQF